MRDKELTPRLEPYYYILPLVKKEESQKEIPAVDLEKAKRREEIIKVVEERFRQESLNKRLAHTKNGDSTVGDVLREGLLGFLPDETLVTDIVPQAVGGILVTDRLTLDPVWEPVSECLNISQITGVLSIFREVRRLSEKLEDDTKNMPIRRSLGQDHLLIVADLRSVTELAWVKLAGIGETRAKILFEATRKID